MNYISCLVVCWYLLTIELAIAESNCICKQLYLRVSRDCENIFNKVENLCNDALGNDTMLEIATCENDITCKKCKEFEEEYDKVNNGFEAFETLLNMTVVNVFLLEENRNECMVSYKRWLCATQFTFYNNTEDSVTCNCKPNIGVCNKVVQNCPYYVPARHQNVDGCKREVIYGGLPAFMCPEEGTDEDKYVHRGSNDTNFYCAP